MTALRARSSPGLSVEVLAARARAGDRRAQRRLRERLGPEVRQLALALGADAWAVGGVVRGALADALLAGPPYATAVVAAVQRRTSQVAGRRPQDRARTTTDRLQRAVGVLCDLQGHSHRSAATLLGCSVAEVAALHRAARSGLGVAPVANRCRGWFLVSAMERLTGPEQEAARRHLSLCPPCTQGLAARESARSLLKAAVPVGGTVLGGAIAAVVGILGSGSTTVGSAVAGAGAALAVAGAAAAPALVPATPAHPHLHRPAAVAVAPALPRTGTEPLPRPSASGGAPTRPPATSAPATSAASATPVPAVTATPAPAVPDAALPTAVPPAVPSGAPASPVPVPGAPASPVPVPGAVPPPVQVPPVQVPLTIAGGVPLGLLPTLPAQLPRMPMTANVVPPVSPSPSAGPGASSPTTVGSPGPVPGLR